MNDDEILVWICEICKDDIERDSQGMVDHFDVVHPFLAAVARESAASDDAMQANAWLN